MARERIYPNNAAKQAAYRVRSADRQPIPQARLANIGEELHGRLRQAIAAGTHRVPAAVLGRRADETLINLMAYITRGVLLNDPTTGALEEEGRGGAARDNEPVDGR